MVSDCDVQPSRVCNLRRVKSGIGRTVTPRISLGGELLAELSTHIRVCAVFLWLRIHNARKSCAAERLDSRYPPRRLWQRRLHSSMCNVLR